MRRTGISIGALLACACASTSAVDSGPAPPDVCQPVGDIALLDEPEAYVNQPVTVHVGGRFMRCDGGLDVTATVQAVVEDPSSEAVTAQLSVHSQRYLDPDGGLAALFGAPFDGGTFVTADVTFTPTATGLHHVVARFEPSLGTLQADVYSMIDARGAAKVVAVPGDCNWFDAWRGLQLCGSFDFNGSGTLWVSADGVQLAQLSVKEVWPTDAGVWTIEPSGQLSLLSFDGSGMSSLGQTTLPAWFLDGGAAGFTPSLAADRGQLLLLSGNQLLLAQPDGDGGLSISDAGQLPVTFAQPASALLRAGEGAFVGGETLPFQMNAPDDCVISFGDGGIRCDVGPTIVALDGTTLWSFELTDGVFSAVTLGPGLVVNVQRTAFAYDVSRSPMSAQPEPLADQSRFIFAIAPPSTGESQSAPAFSVSFHDVVRVPVLAPTPTLAGYGVWAGATPTEFAQLRPRDLGVSEGAVWQYLQATGQVQYLER